MEQRATSRILLVQVELPELAEKFPKCVRITGFNGSQQVLSVDRAHSAHQFAQCGTTLNYTVSPGVMLPNRPSLPLDSSKRNALDEVALGEEEQRQHGD